jgi:hypothetical protein
VDTKNHRSLKLCLALAWILPGCLLDLSGPDWGSTAGEKRGDLSAQMRFVEPLGDLRLVGESTAFSVLAPVQTSEVRYEADGHLLGHSMAAENNFHLTYSFSGLGRRKIKATALSKDGEWLGAAERFIEVVPQSTIRFDGLLPSQALQNGSRIQPASTSDVHTISLLADGFPVATGPANQPLGLNVLVEGNRLLQLVGHGTGGEELSRAEMTVRVVKNGLPKVIPMSTSDAHVVGQPGHLRFRTEGPVFEIKVYADGYPVGASKNAVDLFQIDANFTLGGERMLEVIGLDADGTHRVELSYPIQVESAPALSSMTYFYQYANDLAPGATCQNTSIAMVLSAFGWTGDPDEITAEFGRYTAQSPSGLANIFNVLAQREGVSARLTANTSGTLERLHQLLSQGKPVITHGYFTSFGHVLVVTDFDGTHYTAYDPAGTWSGTFGGGYPHGWEPTAGKGIRYPKAAFEQAISTLDGSTYASLWIHELTP